MKNSIKIWPFLEDISQALIPYNSTTLNSDNDAFIDFSNLKSFSSTGLAITLNKIVPIVSKAKYKLWHIEMPESAIANKFLRDVGGYNILINKIRNKSLFLEVDVNPAPNSFIQNTSLNCTKISFPIYYLEFDRNQKRHGVEKFIEYLIEQTNPILSTYEIKTNVFIKLLKEIAKNSEDHSNMNAIFGMDIIESESKNFGQVVFSFSDMGNGIHDNIKKFIEVDDRLRQNASMKAGFVDTYHYAYKPGFTTKRNSVNKGIGMSMILECVNLLKLQLVIFDAKSMGFIPKENTHEEIRRNFWNSGNSIGFNYYGVMNLKKKQL